MTGWNQLSRERRELALRRSNIAYPVMSQPGLWLWNQELGTFERSRSVLFPQTVKW